MCKGPVAGKSKYNRGTESGSVMMGRERGAQDETEEGGRSQLN